MCNCPYEALLECIHREEVNPELARRDEIDTDHEAALRLALLPVERKTLLRLRDENQIDDVILRRMQARIDLEELRLADDIGTE